MKRKLLDNGNIWQKSDGRWIGLVRYKDEFGVTHYFTCSYFVRNDLSYQLVFEPFIRA